MQEITPPSERSIRNIPIPANHHLIPPLPSEALPKGGRPPKRRRRTGRFLLLALVVIVIFGGIGVGVSTLFAGASVVVHPKTAEVMAPATLKAQLNAPVGTLTFQTITETQSATTTVPASGTAKVSRQAHGVVVISSTYSANQRLIVGTRLEAPDGKIYKLSGSVTLPANGSVTATINADSAGSDYNRSGATTFTLPGYKGDPRYSKFSAKSQGAITGGFVGTEPSVAAADLAAGKLKLQQQLASAVNLGLQNKIPDGYTGVPGSTAVSYSDLAQTAGDKGTATLAQTATATGVVVRVNDLATALARAGVKEYKGEAVGFLEQGTLDMSLATSSKPDDDAITLNLKGSATLLWLFDPNALKAAVLGKEKSQFETIVQSFAPAVSDATASIRPFWIKNFPSDPAKITVVVDSGK